MKKKSSGRLVYVKDRDGSGWNLCGQRVNCGRSLELRMPKNTWMQVRFEMAYRMTRKGVLSEKMMPVLHIPIGCEWDVMFEARLVNYSWRVWDLKRDTVVTKSARHPDKAPDEEGHIERGEPIWETEEDHFSTETGAKRAAEELNGLYGSYLEGAIEWDSRMEFRFKEDRK